MVLEFMSRQDLPLSQIIKENKDAFPSSGEINFKVSDVQGAFSQIIKTFGPKAIDSDYLDGLTLTFKSWRFNLRASQTEPLMRLNIESRGSRELIEEKLGEIKTVLRNFRL